MRTITTSLAGMLLGLSLSSAAIAGDVRIMWYSDGNEGAVLKDLTDRFMKANPDVNIIIDNVPFTAVKEQLPIQLEAGGGPDIARVTNLKQLSKYWLDLTPYVQDPEYWRANFGDQADWMRPDGSKAITGFMTQITLTGGFVNKTLFDQAGVALPGPNATWDDWIAAARKVATAQQVPVTASLDRSGQRVTGPNISFGAAYIGADGAPLPVDAGMEAFLGRLIKWHQDGTMDKSVWVSAAGSTYRAAGDEFINGQLVYYYSGSWQIPNFAAKIGDAFDWVATGSPCGPAACTGMPGGAGLVAIKSTKVPKDVGRVMDFLASREIVKEFSERTLFLPAHKGVLAEGVNFQTANPLAKAALNSFVKAEATLSPLALKMPGWKWSDAYYGTLVTRTGQAIAGELTPQEAYARINQDMAKQVTEAAR